MEKNYKDCEPTICWNDLLSGENTYMTKEMIREKCDCNSKSVCLQLVDLLKNWHLKEAQDLLK